MRKSLSRWSSMTALVISAAGWGFGIVMTKGLLEYVPPFTLLVIQLAASVTLLWTIVIVQRLRIPLQWETFRLGLTGLLEPGLTVTFGTLGLRLTTASLTTLIVAAQPILIIILAWLILREPLTGWLIARSTLAIFGVVLVVGLDTSASSNGSLLGNLLILVAVTFSSFYIILTRRIVAALEPVLLAALQQTIGLVWALIIWPIDLLGVEFASLATISPRIWAWAMVSGIIYYALGFWFYIIGLRKTPASLAALFINLIPAFGVGGAYIFLGERLTVAQGIGAVIILVAVISISRPSSAETIPACRCAS